MKFKLGDRVAFYFHQGRYTGEVIDIRSNEILRVKVDTPIGDYGDMWQCHPKQCRKLKKKVAREWQIYLFPNGTIHTSATLYSAIGGIGFGGTNVITGTQITVREVRKAKK